MGLLRCYKLWLRELSDRNFFARLPHVPEYESYRVPLLLCHGLGSPDPQKGVTVTLRSAMALSIRLGESADAAFAFLRLCRRYGIVEKVQFCLDLDTTTLKGSLATTAILLSNVSESLLRTTTGYDTSGRLEGRALDGLRLADLATRIEPCVSSAWVPLAVYARAGIRLPDDERDHVAEAEMWAKQGFLEGRFPSDHVGLQAIDLVMKLKAQLCDTSEGAPHPP